MNANAQNTHQFFNDQINLITNRQKVLDIIRATDQFRVVSFGKVRKFQAVGLRHKNGVWQVQDTDSKWYNKFWCEA